MKHAYLIIAHNEFEVLQKLIDALDDVRNDIYVHIDAKVRNLPVLTSRKSRLKVLSNRICVIWSDVSQIQSEYLLLEAAFSEQKYDYYHLISGTHYPLKNQDEVHAFFENCHGASVLIPIATSQEEIRMKLGRYHFFLSHLISSNKMVNRMSHVLWRTILYGERFLGVERDTKGITEKVSNWCSLSHEAVSVLLQKKDNVLRQYNRTFCGDEFFVLAVLKETDMAVIKSEQLLFCKFMPYTPKVLVEEDLMELEKSGCLFGRKFTQKSLKLIEALHAKTVIKEDKR